MFRRLLFIIMIALLTVSCSVREGGREVLEEEPSTTGPLFDPLASSADREVIPEVYPIQVAYLPESGDSLVEPLDISYEEFDSTSSAVGPRELYRVQIFTSRLYTEANRERALAEEIFNFPIHLDYEVPYYKLRVGDFHTRAEAEDMLSEIRAIGYRSAWVARVIKRIREAPAYNLIDEPILPLDSTGFSPIKPDSASQDDYGEDR